MRKNWFSKKEILSTPSPPPPRNFFLTPIFWKVGNSIKRKHKTRNEMRKN